MLIIKNRKEIEITAVGCASVNLLFFKKKFIFIFRIAVMPLYICISKIFFKKKQMFYFYFQNCSNTPLIRKSLKVEHTIEACGPFRILGNLGEIKYKGGISTKCPVSFLENQQTSSLYCS